MRTFIVLVFPSFLLTAPLSLSAAVDGARKLNSFEKGFFYASTSKGDGVIQLSACKKVTKAERASFKDFICIHDGKGFRCTTNDSLDVIFLFDSLKECDADRTRTLDSEEE